MLYNDRCFIEATGRFSAPCGASNFSSLQVMSYFEGERELVGIGMGGGGGGGGMRTLGEREN